MANVDVDAMFLDDVDEGFTGPLVVMLCRRWDVITIKNKYMSTDYIVSDKKGNVMHCFVKSNVAHRFKNILQEGGLYMIKDFTVVLNSEKYRVMKDATFMLEFHGSTVVRKATDDPQRFNRYPFNLVSFEELEPTEMKYFVDIIGYVTIIGKPLKKSTGSHTVEFNLTNERGYQIRVTLWGDLGDDIVVKKSKNPGAYVILLTCMNVKEYLGNLCVSSSSSTLLVDGKEIPAIKEFEAALSGVEVVDTGLPLLQVKPTLKNLGELLAWGRVKGKREVAAFQGSVTIANVRTKSSWFNYTCTVGKCRKGVSPNKKGEFWCDSCDKVVSYPRPRFRIQIEVTDGTADCVVVLFDETAEKLVGRTVGALISDAEKDDTGDSFVMPPILRDLIGTSHVFEIKSTTYYHVGDYESFNCSDIIKPGTGSSDVKFLGSSSNIFQDVPPIPTPVKQNEGKQHKISIEDSGMVHLDSDGVAGSKAVRVLRARKRRIEELDSDVEIEKPCKGSTDKHLDA